MKHDYSMTLRIFVLSLLAGCFLPGFAQHRIEGRVNDIEQKALPYASVRLLHADSTYVTGMTTDSLGRYRFADVASGDYLLSFSILGYKPKSVAVSVRDVDVNLPVVCLEGDDVLLSEVTVSGSSIIYKRDRTLIIPDMQQRKHAYSGYDLLYNLMIPGIDVNTRKGTVSNERGAVTVYINGVRADMREVQNLRPKDIEKVEYYDMPSGIFTGDIASLNYITKTYKAGGYIALDGEQTLGYTAGDYNVGAKLVKGKTSYTFFGGYNMSKHDGTEEEKNEVINFPDEAVHRDRSTENAFYKNNQQYAQFKVNYAEEKYNLFAQAALTRDDTPRNGRDEALHYSSDASQNVDASNWTEEESLKPSLCLDGLFYPTKAQRIHVRAMGSYSDNTYQRNYAEDERLSKTHVDEDYYSFNLLGVYGINLKNSTLGASIMHDHHITSSTYTGDYDSWQHLWRGETIVYLSYMQHLMNDKWTFLLYPGVSFLNYRLHSQALQRYWTFRTNSWIRYQPNKNHQFLGGFAMGNNQPDISSMNDMDQTVDFLQIKRGNPNLDNPVIQEFFFTYNAKLHPVNLKLNLWSTILKHNIRSAYFIERDKLVNTFRSDATYRKWKAELSASCRISDNLRANGKLRYEKFEYPSIPGLDTDNFFASLDVDYYFKSFTLRGWVKSTERTLDNSSLAITKSPCTYGFSLRYNASNWMAEVGTANPFNAHSHYREYLYTDAYQYNQVRTGRIYQQTGYVRVAYTFDFGKKTSKERNNVDRSINSAILKAN
ncbi:carboxypeptidase-like regulatory domain-containing protein [Phocaeicola salanitronis]|uniref:TonB-dependent receptor n=1 Tax=Phocaeicola salanitronis TaxID=376805 RepID=UPI0023F86977|nr:carboxypeptidase-like regulatory domain-containing protein [Phocaeicola salanitronis]